MTRPRSFVSAIALVTTLVTGKPVAAQSPAANGEAFNRILETSTCEKAIDEPAYPFSITGYPFSVARLNRALAANGPEISEVNVAVFDNDFLGYRTEPNPDDGELRMKPSRNFPKEFFLKRNNAFSPYFDNERRPLAPPPPLAADVQDGHGTSIAGIILGGKYDDDAEPEDSGSLLSKPNVRNLLTYGVSGSAADGFRQKSWLRLAFVPVGYASSGRSSDPITELENFFEEAGGLPKVDIINMSFGQEITDGSTIAFNDAVRGLLIVAAAGNNKREIPGPNFSAKPASAEDKGIMLVVASHDADGNLSGFSNYGEHVTIAAPGCAIKSWIDGYGDARPLSGTSMATALVSFAGALVDSRWGLTANIGVSLRNRLISSARYNPELSKCGLTKGQDECVQSGNMLDVEAAVLVNRDYLEYEICTDDQDARTCSPRIAVGTLMQTPDAIGACMQTALYGSKPLYPRRAGMTLNGAIKRISGTNYKIFYEQGAKVGTAEIGERNCDLVDNLGETLIFQPLGEQLDGLAASTEPIPVPMARVVRLVVRATAPRA